LGLRGWSVGGSEGQKVRGVRGFRGSGQEGLGIRVQGLGPWVCSLGFKVQGMSIWFLIWDLQSGCSLRVRV